MLLILAIALGVFFRVTSLEIEALSSDALTHVYAGESYRENGVLALPSGYPYERGSDITHLINLTRSLAPQLPIETAARLPSAVFGVLNLLLMAFVAWRLGGIWVAAVATLLLAIYPEAVYQSRHARFYTYQLCMGILALYTGWMAVSRLGLDRNEERGYLPGLFWALATVGLLFLAAARAQPTSLSMLAAWGAAVACMAAFDLRSGGSSAWRRSGNIHLSLAGAAALALTAVLFPDSLASLWTRSQAVAPWAGGGASDIRAHYWQLAGTFPWMIPFLPLFVIVSLAKTPRQATYLMALFSVIILLHTFVFAWKLERYILLSTPPLFLLGAHALVSAGSGLRRFLCDVLPVQQAGVAANLIITVIASWALVTTPAFTESRVMATRSTPEFDWRMVAALFAEQNTTEGVVVGSSAPMRMLFYAGTLDFATPAAGLLRLKPSDLTETERLPQGAPERSTAVPVLTTPEAIRSHFPWAQTVLVAIPDTHLNPNMTDPRLADFLKRSAEELCRGRCGRIELYRWSTLASDQAELAD